MTKKANTNRSTTAAPKKQKSGAQKRKERAARDEAARLRANAQMANADSVAPIDSNTEANALAARGQTAEPLDVTHALADVFPATLPDDVVMSFPMAMSYGHEDADGNHHDGFRRDGETVGEWYARTDGVSPLDGDRTPNIAEQVVGEIARQTIAENDAPSLDAIAAADAVAETERAAKAAKRGKSTTPRAERAPRYAVHPALADVTPKRWQQRFMYRATRIINRAAARGEVVTLDAAIAKATRGSDIARNQKPASLLAFLASIGDAVKDGAAPERKRGADRKPTARKTADASSETPSAPSGDTPSTNGTEPPGRGDVPDGTPRDYAAKILANRNGDECAAFDAIDKRRKTSIAASFDRTASYYADAIAALDDIVKNRAIADGIVVDGRGPFVSA